jgi:hypothetical protein
LRKLRITAHFLSPLGGQISTTPIDWCPNTKFWAYGIFAGNMVDPRRGLVCLRSPKIDHFLRWLFGKPPRNAERIANAGKMISQSLEIIWNGEEWTPKSRRRET